MLVPGSAKWNSVYENAVSNGIDVFGGGAGILDLLLNQIVLKLIITFRI